MGKIACCGSVGKHILATIPWCWPLYYMIIYEVESTCSEIRTYSFTRNSDQMKVLVSVVAHEIDLYITFGISLIASVGAILVTSKNGSGSFSYFLVLMASISIAFTISALYLSYFSLRSNIPEVESGQFCIPIFSTLSFHIGLSLLLGASSALIILYWRVREAFAE